MEPRSLLSSVQAFREYYNRLREALVIARTEPELMEPQYVAGVADTFKALKRALIQKLEPKDLEEIRAFEPELWGEGLRFLIAWRLGDVPDAVLDWYMSRLQEFGGTERIVADPNIRTVDDLMAKIGDFEPWRA